MTSFWAAAAWEEINDRGYFDGMRSGAAMTRKKKLPRFSTDLRKNSLKLIAGTNRDVEDLDERLQKIEVD